MGPIGTSAGNRIAVLYRAYTSDSCPEQQSTSMTPRSRRCCRDKADQGPGKSGSKLIFDIQRYAAEQQYVRAHECRRDYKLLAAVCEELCPQPQLRRRLVAAAALWLDR